MIPIKEQLLAAFSLPSIVKPQASDDMARPKTNHRKLATPDKQGRIRQVVGYTQDGKKARFQIADRNTSPAEALKRLNLIQLLYEKQCEKADINFWDKWTQTVAMKIGKGEPILDRCIGHSTVHQAGVVDQLRAWGIPVGITDERKYAEGVAIQKEQITTLVQQLVAQSMEKARQWHGTLADTATLPGDPLILTETATFYDALDAYRDHIKATGKRDKTNKLTTNCRQRILRAKYLKEHHKDTPLWKLDLPQLEKLAAYWRNRPSTKKSDRCSREHARDMLKETWRFLRWLDKQPNYRWLLPRGADEIKRSPISLPGDDDGQAFQTITKETYTPEQLAIIAQFTDAFGRALIGACVNCAFGQSEIGQWPTSKFVLHKAHPHADKLGIDSTDADSWIVGNRPKTGVYGEHLLWPQVADALAPFLDGREVIPITSRQTPWFKTHSANPQATFTNWWRDLMDQVLKVYPDLMYLPFGSLRDLLPDLLRTRYSDDIASLALQHGNLSDDTLLKHYANHPYGRLFVATRELEGHFKPFLDTLISDASGERK